MTPRRFDQARWGQRAPPATGSSPPPNANASSSRISTAAPDAQTHLARAIAATDRAIDALVYSLYGLAAAEIQLVEQATATAVAKPVAPESTVD